MGIFSVFTNIAPATVYILKENPPDYYFLMALQDGFKERCYFCKLSTSRDISGAKDIYSLAKSIKYNIFYSAPAYKTDEGAYNLLQDQDFVLKYQEFEDFDFKLYGESKQWENFDPSILSKIQQSTGGYQENYIIGSRSVEKIPITTEEYLKKVVRHVVTPIMQSWQKKLIVVFRCDDLLALREAWILAVLATYREVKLGGQQASLPELCFQEMKEFIPEQLLMSIHNKHELPLNKFIQAIIDYNEQTLGVFNERSMAVIKAARRAIEELQKSSDKICLTNADNDNKTESQNLMIAFCLSISARTESRMNIMIHSAFDDIVSHYLATVKKARVLAEEVHSKYTINQDTPPKTEPLPMGRYNLAISSTKVIEDKDGKPDRLLVNFKAEAPAGCVVPPTSFSLKHEAGKEALTNLLYAAGCREPIGLPDFPGLCLSGSLYMDEEGWPTWGNWEPTK